MAIYEYERLKCGERFELRRSMSDSDGEVKLPQVWDRRVYAVFSQPLLPLLAASVSV